MLVVFILNQPCRILLRNPSKNCRDCACLLININEASPWTGNMLVVFILNQPCKILLRNPSKNCRECACLLININEASPWTGNMQVVFILNQLCKTAHLQTLYICKQILYPSRDTNLKTSVKAVSKCGR